MPLTIGQFRGMIGPSKDNEQELNRPQVAAATGGMLITPASTTVGSTDAPRVIAMVLLIVFLVAKEITIAAPDRGTYEIGRILDLGLIPLLIVSGAVIVTEIVL